MTLEEALTIMFARYPGREFTQGNLAGYMSGLEDLPEPLTCDVIDKLSRRSKWPPNVADITNEVAERLCALPEPAVAWETMQTVEGRRSAPPLVKRAWKALGETPAFDLGQSGRAYEMRRTFTDLYTELRAAEIKRVAEGGPVELEPPAHLRQIEGGNE